MTASILFFIIDLFSPFKNAIIKLLLHASTRYTEYKKGRDFLLENLILAYRRNFYALSRKKIKMIFNKNKWLILGFIGFVLLFIGASIISIIYMVSWPLYIIIAIEIGFIIIGDSTLTKKYQELFLSREKHLSQIYSFLENGVIGFDFSAKKQIEELIKRLNIYVDVNTPFLQFKKSVITFTQLFIVPFLTFIGGVYIVYVSEIGSNILIGGALAILIFIGLLWIAGRIFSPFLKMIIARDYNAAIALREDLLDIKLLYFEK